MSYPPNEQEEVVAQALTIDPVRQGQIEGPRRGFWGLLPHRLLPPQPGGGGRKRVD